MNLPATLRSRLDRDPELPSLPSAVVGLLALWRDDDDPDPAAVAAAVAREPALAAKLIRYANSAEIAPTAPIRTLASGVSMLGTRRTRNVVLTFALLPLQARGGEGFRVFWRRGLVSSIVARHFARLARWSTLQPDEASLAALLQDIGVLVLLMVLARDYHELVVESGLDHALLLERERAMLGADHAEVGAWLLERWRLPETIVTAVHGTHAGSECEQGPGSMAELIASAGAIADAWADDRLSDRTDEPSAPAGDDESDSVRVALAHAGREIAAVAALFDLEPATPHDASRLVAEARGIMARGR